MALWMVSSMFTSSFLILFFSAVGLLLISKWRITVVEYIETQKDLISRNPGFILGSLVIEVPEILLDGTFLGFYPVGFWGLFSIPLILAFFLLNDILEFVTFHRLERLCDNIGNLLDQEGAPLTIFDPDFKPNVSLEQAVENLLKSQHNSFQWNSIHINQLHQRVNIKFNELPHNIQAKLEERYIKALLYYTNNYSPEENVHLYKFLNRSLANRKPPREYLDYIYYLLEAASKLPDYTGKVYRAMDTAVRAETYQNTKVRWVAFSSTSKRIGQAEIFLKKAGTMMEVNVIEGKDIRDYSAYPAEEEVLLLPNVSFNIISFTQTEKCTKVVLQQETETPHLQKWMGLRFS